MLYLWPAFHHFGVWQDVRVSIDLRTIIRVRKDILQHVWCSTDFFDIQRYSDWTKFDELFGCQGEFDRHLTTLWFFRNSPFRRTGGKTQPRRCFVSSQDLLFSEIPTPGTDKSKITAIRFRWLRNVSTFSSLSRNTRCTGSVYKRFSPKWRIVD